MPAAPCSSTKNNKSSTEQQQQQQQQEQQNSPKSNMKLISMTITLTLAAAILSLSASAQRRGGRGGRGGRRPKGGRPNGGGGNRPGGGGGGGGKRPKPSKPSGPRFPACADPDAYFIIVNSTCGQLGVCPTVTTGSVNDLNNEQPDSLSCTNVMLDPEANVSCGASDVCYTAQSRLREPSLPSTDKCNCHILVCAPYSHLSTPSLAPPPSVAVARPSRGSRRPALGTRTSSTPTSLASSTATLTMETIRPTPRRRGTGPS